MGEETRIVPLQIYKALVAVGAELGKVGVAKDRKNEAQNFRFRGIDDVMNAVSPILTKHDVLFLPSYGDYTETDRVTGKGATLIHAKLMGHYRFISAVDGSWVDVITPGVAMDSGDKACNKAMSAALKHALLQTFLIPTESNEDADATTQEPSRPAPPDAFEEAFAELLAIKGQGWDALANAWRSTKKVFRDYALAYRKDEWNAAKALAMTITAGAQRPPAELPEPARPEPVRPVTGKPVAVK